MNSTFGASFTGFVPETITGHVPAGQDAVDRYKSRFDMKRTMGNADQGIEDRNGSDLRGSVPAGPAQTRPEPTGFVPVFYRGRRSLGQRLTDIQAGSR